MRMSQPAPRHARALLVLVARVPLHSGAACTDAHARSIPRSPTSRSRRRSCNPENNDVRRERTYRDAAADDPAQDRRLPGRQNVNAA